uniref:Uncharacterized protein n=1 Tax=Romanomermis culicivorax TaxID=13658 RepID=A0A915KNN0_ROMCU
MMTGSKKNTKCGLVKRGFDQTTEMEGASPSILSSISPPFNVPPFVVQVSQMSASSSRQVFDN